MKANRCNKSYCDEVAILTATQLFSSCAFWGRALIIVLKLNYKVKKTLNTKISQWDKDTGLGRTIPTKQIPQKLCFKISVYYSFNMQACYTLGFRCIIVLICKFIRMHEIYKDTIHISPLLCILSSINTNKRIYVTGIFHKEIWNLQLSRCHVELICD